MSTGLRAAICSILIAGAVGIEAAGARALAGGALPVAFYCHVLAAALAGVAGAQSRWARAGTLRCDRVRPRAEALRLACVSASLVLALPAVGLGAILVLALTIRARPRGHSPVREIERAWLRPAALVFAPGTSLRSCDQSCGPVAGADPPADASLQARLARLLVLRHAPGARAVRCLRFALADPNEEVRLLASALLEQRQNAQRAIIDDAHVQLQRLGSLEQALGAEAAQRSWLLRLTQAHWELASSTLLRGAPADAALEGALRFGQDALAIRFDGATALLLARVSLARDDVTSAQRWLGHAARVGVAASARAPFEAEASFRQRRAEALARRLRRARRIERAGRRVG